jgi:DNA-binding Lrp family transcriptional regulator
MVLSETDRRLIGAIQEGLPLVAHPYAAVGARLDLSEAEVLRRIERLLEAGVIKRMGVVVRHRALGYRANAMVVWDIPDAEVQRIGERLAAEECITLCYQRPRRLPEWPYNLFCMIHGRERSAVLQRLSRIIQTHGLEGVAHSVLFSTRSFKQCGARYVPARTAQSAGERAHG